MRRSLDGRCAGNEAAPGSGRTHGSHRPDLLPGIGRTYAPLRLLERRRKQAAFRDPERTLDNFDFSFNPKTKRSLVFDLATGAFINKREDALFLGPGGTGKSHLAQAIAQAVILQGYRVLYRETHVLLDELADAVAEGTCKEYMESVATVPLLIIDDFGMRKFPHTAAEDLLEIIMRCCERFSTLLTSPVRLTTRASCLAMSLR
jgi:DNA replication protein DnaC